jgi:hypothetical protein
MYPARALLSGLTGVFLLSGHDARAQDHHATLLATDRLTAELSRDSGLTRALLRNVHPDAVLLWPGAPVVIGKDRISRLLGAVDSDSLFVTWQPLHLELARDSSLAATWGVTVTAPRQDVRATEMGRYIAVWRRDRSRWSLAALVFSGLKGSPGAAWPSGLTREQAPLQPSGPAAGFVEADLAFARMAGDSGAGVAFRRWAAPEAVMPGGRGLLTRGPEAIGRMVAGPATWTWYPVAAGTSRSGDIGWTVGQAVIAAKETEPSYSKYLTVWARLPGGAIRFLTDGGNARPEEEKP